MAVGQVKQKQIKINIAQFESLCKIQCTKDEICSVLDVSQKTLNSWCKSTYGKNFSLVFKEKRQAGCMSLRRKQWDLADKSPAMAIFLGKNYLGQKDQIETEENDKTEEVKKVLVKIKKVAEADGTDRD